MVTWQPIRQSGLPVATLFPCVGEIGTREHGRYKLKIRWVNSLDDDEDFQNTICGSACAKRLFISLGLDFQLLPK